MIMKRLAFLASLLTLACLPMLPALAQAPPPYVNVVDYGATPDQNGDNDATAINNAINAACSGSGPRAVFFPAGQYVISTSIDCSYASGTGLVKDGLKLFGTGRMANGVNNFGQTHIAWNGSAGGTMVNVTWTLALRVQDIAFSGDYNNDGTNKAAKGFVFDSTGGRVTDELSFERVMVQSCSSVGMECSTSFCNGDMTLIDVTFLKCDTGFKTLGDQNLNYVFIRPEARECTIGFHFAKGGFVAMEGLAEGSVRTAVKIESGSSNSGNYVINGMRVECYLVDGYRPVMFDIEGWCSTVKVCNLDTGVSYVEDDKTTPLFKLATSSFLKVESSKLYSYRLADLTGTSNGGQSFLELDNCRFSTYSDPRVEGTITHDAYSGFNVRNCEVGGGIISCTHDHELEVTPMPPTNLTATRYSSTQINLAWTDNSTEDTFQIWRKTGAGGTWAYLNQVGSNVTTYSNTGLTTGTTYYYRVYAKKIVRSIDSVQASATP